jgi:uncharacterized protein (TIGR03437 family)
VQPQSDCNILNDCSANYYPHLFVLPNPVRLTAIAGGAMTSQPGSIGVENSGGGTMPWTAVVRYTNGADWLTLDGASGRNNGTVRMWAKSLTLAAGTYQAVVTIDAGLAGAIPVPVTLVVAPAPTLPTPTPTPTPAPTPTPTPTPNPPAGPSVTVSQMVNAATFQVTPMVPGSLGTLMGSNLAGANVSVTFDGIPAELLYRSASQINLQVPQGLASKTSAQVVVSVDGNRSAPFTVALAPAWPSVFASGVLNQDNTVNSTDSAARPGSVLQIFATGIPSDATVSVVIGDRDKLVPLYAAPAPSVPGVQQVNVAVPEDIAGSKVRLSICAQTAERQYCSADYSLAVQ